MKLQKLNSCKVLILDFDGVIIESNNIKTEAFKYIFRKYPEFENKMMKYHEENVSLSRFSKFEYFLKLIGKENDNELYNELAKAFSSKVFESIINVPFVNGAVNFLKMAAKILPVYLASVTPDDELKVIIEKRGLSSYFKGVYGCPPWTKSDAINDILLKEQVQSNQVILIGDSAGDQLAASNCKIGFIARNSGLNFNKPPELIFDDFHDIEKYFKNNIL